VCGTYILEVVQSAVITKNGFWTFVTSLGDVQVFNRPDMTRLSVPTLTAIGGLFRTEHEGLISNIQPSYLLCPGILCASDPHVGTIEEARRSDNYCESSKV